MKSNNGKLFLVRHGNSTWNQKELFTGWVNVTLSAKGIDEATRAGIALSKEKIDIVFTSELLRAQMTAAIIMIYSENPPLVFQPQDGADPKFIHNAQEVTTGIIAQELNERCYGSLQGLNKAATSEKYGADQVLLWRRSFDEVPPDGESLAMVCQRVIPYYQAVIEPLLAEGKNILIAAHGNSLRALIMHIEKIPSEEIAKLEIATSEIRTYEASQILHSSQSS